MIASDALNWLTFCADVLSMLLAHAAASLAILSMMLWRRSAYEAPLEYEDEQGFDFGEPSWRALATALAPGGGQSLCHPAGVAQA